MTDLLTRKAVRHAILRAHHTRVLEARDERWPLALHMHPDSLSELLVDGDPDEQHTLDFEGLELLRIPIVTDQRLAPGEVRIQWPAKKEAPR